MKLRRAILTACLAILSLPPLPALAIPEDGYAGTFAQDVAPFFERGVKGEFAGVAGVPIRYVYFLHPEPRGAVVVSNGYTENFQKYAEVAYDLFGAGYSVFLLDHRGQGNSGRLLKNPNLGYIDRFDYFVADLHAFTEKVAKPHARAGQPFLLLAHSMGGAIGARYLEQFPHDFTAAVLSAPMFGIKLGSWDPALAKAILRALEFLGQGKSIAIGSEQTNPVNQPFEENELTHSRARYRMAREAIRQNPDSILEAATNSWVLRAMRGGEKALKEAARIRVPVLLFQAEEDSFVTLKPQEDFCRALPRCELVKVPGSRHEVLMESDSMRTPALARILRFFAGAGARD